MTAGGKLMTNHLKPWEDGPEPTSTSIPTTRLAEQGQLDFELEFFAGIIERKPDYVDALRVMGNNLTLKGRYPQGLIIDRRLVQLRPSDPLAHYNLACSYALLHRAEQAIRTLRHAVELGYRDFNYMRKDHDLDTIRHDPRFRQLLSEHENQ
jgi:tetratricopeptide (TPR) repeat protein